MPSLREYGHEHRDLHTAAFLRKQNSRIFRPTRDQSYQELTTKLETTPGYSSLHFRISVPLSMSLQHTAVVDRIEPCIFVGRRLHSIAKCENPVSGAAPCQCTTLGAISTTFCRVKAIAQASFFLIIPATTHNNKNLSSVWLYQLFRQPGSNVTLEIGTFKSLSVAKRASHDFSEILLISHILIAYRKGTDVLKNFFCFS